MSEHFYIVCSGNRVRIEALEDLRNESIKAMQSCQDWQVEDSLRRQCTFQSAYEALGGQPYEDIMPDMFLATAQKGVIVPIFEIASHQNEEEMDIVAAGRRMAVTTLREVSLHTVAEPITDETHPVVGYHVDGDNVGRADFIMRLSDLLP